ncbi:MAG: FUSC family protein [Micrococcaceae bacterium]
MTTSGSFGASGDSSSREDRDDSRRARLTRFTRRRLRSGASRARSALVPAATSAVAAVGAYLFAERVLGHHQPLFASTAALIALGFGRDPRVRKVLEIAVGCTLGILIGDLMLTWLGANPFTALLVVFVSIIVARFLDSGVIFTTQMSLQSVLVVLLPMPANGPFDRSIDAVVGGVIALVITLLFPKNLQREPAEGMRKLYSTVTQVLRDCSLALRTHESRHAWMGLVSCRGTQGILDDLRKDLLAAVELATYSPTKRSSRQILDETQDTVEMTDLAVRSLRIVARRVVTVVDQAMLDDDGMTRLADWFDEAADAVGILGRSLSEPGIPGRHRSLSVARDALGSATAQLDPAHLGATTLHSEALVMLLRPMMVDFLEATGTTHDEAVSYLPHLS